MKLRRKFDAVIVGAGGAGMRASLQLAEAGSQRRGAVEGVPDALAHGRGAGRHRRVARQHVARTTGSGTCTTRSRAPTVSATRTRSSTCAGWRRKSSTSSSTSACRSTAMPDGTIYQRPFGGHSANFGEKPVQRACAAADRTGHAMLHTLYQRNVRARTQFFVEWMALDLIRDAEGDVLGVIALEMETGEVDDPAGARRRCSPPAAPAASSPRRPTRSSTPATASAWRRAPAFRSRTWSSGSSIRPASPARAC